MVKEKRDRMKEILNCYNKASSSCVKLNRNYTKRVIILKERYKEVHTAYPREPCLNCFFFFSSELNVFISEYFRVTVYRQNFTTSYLVDMKWLF